MRSLASPEIAVSAIASNIVRLGEPSRTAHRVATLRAVHQLLDEPVVLPDPIALPILGAATEAALRDDSYALNDPILRSLRAAVVVRSRVVEDELARGVADGVLQHVVLGAGLDTYAWRNPHGGRPLRIFEVDHAGTQRWKQQLLADAHLAVPPALAFVPLDFERDDPVEALVQAGFRRDQPACVGWMGVTPYLTEDAVMRTLRTLAGLAPGSVVCFDYRVAPGLLGPVDRVINEMLASKAAAAGEPWVSSFDPVALQGQVLALGFGSAVSLVPDELNARYYARRKDGLRIGGSFRILRASVGGP